LEHVTAVLDAVTCSFLRLDEGIELHRVSFAKKAIALFNRSTSACRRRFSRRSSRSSSCSLLVSPSRWPESISDCSTQRRTADSTRLKSLATWAIDRSPSRQRSTISALNSGVNDRRERGFFFATVSILDILSGATPHLVDVRQTVPTPK